MELITTHVVSKFDIGINDNLFGGKMMSWIDLAGASLAAITAKTGSIVTKKISEVLFLSPVKVNSILKIYGEVLKIGNTSLTLKIEAHRLDVESGKEVIVCSCDVVFVKVNGYGEPSPLNIKKQERIIPVIGPEEREKLNEGSDT